jgi:hypothetical protein
VNDGFFPNSETFLIAMNASDKAKQLLVPESFVCVECGAPQSQLYIEYGKGNIKLVKCVSFHVGCLDTLCSAIIHDDFCDSTMESQII